MDEKQRTELKRELARLATELGSPETQERIAAQVRRNIGPEAREHARFLRRSRAIAHLRMIG